MTGLVVVGTVPAVVGGTVLAVVAGDEVGAGAGTGGAAATAMLRTWLVLPA